mmetsp:Transcript_46455/g.92008  ORF Transcript_46455/g.92008 Transcript_46455/m.92008 type:complete len:169 (-) Transcript_46455:264-770(-)
MIRLFEQKLFDAVIRNDEVDTMNLLIETPSPDVNFALNDKTSLMAAAELGFTNIIAILVKEGNANINFSNAHGKTALHWACGAGKTEIVKQLLAFGADVNLPDKVGRNALMYASVWGFRDIVDLLIQSGADMYVVDNDGFTPMSVAKNDLTRRVLADYMCNLKSPSSS